MPNLSRLDKIRKLMGTIRDSEVRNDIWSRGLNHTAYEAEGYSGFNQFGQPAIQYSPEEIAELRRRADVLNKLRMKRARQNKDLWHAHRDEERATAKFPEVLSGEVEATGGQYLGDEGNVMNFRTDSDVPFQVTRLPDGRIQVGDNVYSASDFEELCKDLTSRYYR